MLSLTHLKKPYILALLTLFFIHPSLANDDANIAIKTAKLTLQEQTYLLSARINYTLSEEALKALNNGVTLTFNVELSIIEPRNWLWDKHHSSILLSYQIKYHTLAQIYQVTDTKNNLQHNFSRLEPALHSIGTLSEIAVNTISMHDKVNLDGSLKAYLNIEALPLPMRPMAYITPGWHLYSDTFRWPLRP
tara:strand:+ start:134574 stop:135146 length:573 start_codon:yes stop_codon:yes gene_type:complete